MLLPLFLFYPHSDGFVAWRKRRLSGKIRLVGSIGLMGIAGIVGFRRGVDDFRWFFLVVVAGLWFFGGFWRGCCVFVGEKFCHIGKSYYFCNRK